MGQALGSFGGKEWRDAQLMNISNKIFNTINNDYDQSHKDKLPAQYLYEATLRVYNDINKKLPGPHLDPPTKKHFDKLVAAHIKKLIKESDKNKDGVIDRAEFLDFILRLTSDTFVSVWHRLPIVTLVVAPTVAVVTKKSTEGIPGVGKFVQKIPLPAYASLVTLAVLTFQTAQQRLL